MNCLLPEFINKQKRNVSKIFATLTIYGMSQNTLDELPIIGQPSNLYGHYISVKINGYQFLDIVDILNKNATQIIGNDI